LEFGAKDTAVIDGGARAGECADSGFRDTLLRELCSAGLDPLFWSPARPGVASAWHGHVPFAHRLVHALRPRVIVELGTHSGVSYSAFCEGVVQSRLDTRCYAVDTWEGDEHAGAYGEEVYQEFKAFHDSRYAGFSHLLRTTFDDAAGHFADGSIDLLHIDGFHSYEAVSGDFRRWRPKLSACGVVLFHDTNVREQGFGVWRFWEEVRRNHCSFEFLHGYGLGVLIVGAEVPAAIAALGALADPQAVTRIRERFATLGQRHILDFGLAVVEQKAEEVRSQLTAEASRSNELRQALEAAQARGAADVERARAEV
jgi:Methyltransferase domain